jgi:hypothetical protein
VVTFDWQVENSVDLQGSLRLGEPAPTGGRWASVWTDQTTRGGTHGVLIAGRLLAKVAADTGPLQVHLRGVLRSSPALTFVEAHGLAVHERLLPGKAGVLLQGLFTIEEGGPRTYVDEYGKRVEQIALWGAIATDLPELGGSHRVLLAGNSQINLVADAARRWSQHQQSGPLRAQVRGVLRSGRDRVFVEARYVEFFGVPE